MPDRVYIAMLVAGHTTFGRAAVRGAVAYCRQQENLQLHVEGSGFSGSRYPVITEATRRLNKVGFIVEAWSVSQLELALGCGTAVVDISGSFEMAGISRVQSDNLAVGRLAARHFLDRGIRHFAYFGAAPDVLHSSQRRRGFVDELASCGCHCDVFPWDPSYTETIFLERVPLGQWLMQMPKPLGLLCCSDLRAREAIFAAHDVGLRIPDDVAIVGVGNDDLACEICMTPLSSVDISPVQTGYLAAATLHKMWKTGKAPSKPMLVQPAGVVVRQSSDILSAGNDNATAALRFIQCHAHQPIEISDILKAVPVSRRTLEKNFKSLLGRTPQEQIFFIRVEQAKKMLVETDQPLWRVADQCGFKHQSTFSVLFKRLTGMAPGEYRRQFRGCEGN